MHNRFASAGGQRSTERSHQTRRRLLFLTATVVAALTFPLIAVRALSGDGAASVTAEPAAVIAGTTITFTGTGLEPNADRVLVLDGGGVLSPREFSRTLTIPGHLPSGSYALRAVGAETLTTTIDITAAIAGTASSPRTDATGVIQSRSSGDLAAPLAAAVVIVLAAAVVAWRAERLGRQLRPRVQP
jgi:hypothetical protein